MKLLFVTQVMDKNDTVLGAYHGWVTTLAPRFERITVICLYEGEHDLPDNVEVHSLGKERGKRSPLVYAIRFKALAWKLRRDYDAVFVHMNQEYLLIAGLMWKLLGKRMYLWRNHYAGSLVTDLAALFCTKVFCTSTHSYTARYKKTVLMPVGVDTERFKPDSRIARAPHSILFLARMAPSKRPELLIEALALLTARGVSYTADFVGSPRIEDESYYEALKQDVRARGLAEHLSFRPEVPNVQAPALYQAHGVFVNCSPSGMFDKTLFEAAACLCRVLAASPDFAALAGPGSSFDSAATLAQRLAEALAAGTLSAVPAFVAQESLAALGERLTQEMSLG